jgi:hypothetical protein
MAERGQTVAVRLPLQRVTEERPRQADLGRVLHAIGGLRPYPELPARAHQQIVVPTDRFGDAGRIDAMHGSGLRVMHVDERAAQVAGRRVAEIIGPRPSDVGPSATAGATDQEGIFVVRSECRGSRAAGHGR